METLHALSEFGLTRQEGAIYLCLLAEGDLNGYELAKRTGISRSNIYSALSGLVALGAAWTIEGESTSYRAVPGAEFTGNRLRYWQSLQQDLLPALPVPRQGAGSYLTIKGKRAIMDRMHNLLASTRERVYLSVAPEVLETCRGQLTLLAGSGRKMVILSDAAGCALARAGWPEATIHRSIPLAGQVRLIVDSHHVLTGELADDSECTCLYSDHHNLVELFKSSLKNEIRLAEFENTAGMNPKEQP